MAEDERAAVQRAMERDSARAVPKDDQPALRLADLAWWRQWLAEPAVFWLEWVVPRHKRFHLTLDPVDGRTLSDEVFEAEAQRKRERNKSNVPK